MFGYGSKYLNVLKLIKLRRTVYKYQRCEWITQVEYKMFKTINNSRNISPKEIILVSN